MRRHADLGEDRHQGRTEGLEVFLGLPDVEHLQLTLGFEGDVEVTPLRRSGAVSFQPLDGFVVLLGREPDKGEIDPERHDVPTLSAQRRDLR